MAGSEQLTGAVTEPVLAVDIDGTLIVGNVASLAAWTYACANPLRLAIMLYWFLGGGVLRNKIEISRRLKPDYGRLVWRSEVLDFVRQEQNRGRRVVLASGMPETYAQDIARQLGGFYAAHGSNANCDLQGSNKADLLDLLYGVYRWDYIGDSGRRDPPVMRRARISHLAGSSPRLRAAAREVGHDFAAPRAAKR